MPTTSLRRRLLLVGAASLLPLAVASGFSLLALVDHRRGRGRAFAGGVRRRNPVSIALGIVAAVLVGRRIVGPMSALRAAAAAPGRRERLESPATDIHEIREVADALAAAGAQRDRAEAEREELLAREREARAAAEALAAGARTINTRDLDAALQNITGSACTLLQAHVATVFRLDPESDGLVLIVGGGPQGTTLSRNAVVPRGAASAGGARRSGVLGGRSRMHGDEHAAAAGMEWRHVLEPGSHLAPVDVIAGRAGGLPILALDSDSDPSARVVCAHHGPRGQHVEPLAKEVEFAEPVGLGFRPVGQRRVLETLPP